MKKTILIAAGFAVLSALPTVGAHAQTTGPAGQDTAMKSGTTAGAMNAQTEMSEKMMMKKKRMMMAKKKKKKMMMMKKDM